MILCMGCEAPNGHEHICRGYRTGKKCQCCKCHPHEEPKNQARFDFDCNDDPPAEFRLNRRARTSVVIPDDESLFVRAQAIVAAHQDLPVSDLTSADADVLRKIVQRARKAARAHPNEAIEVSPYVAAVLGLEA